jgi:hypothetical protein
MNSRFGGNSVLRTVSACFAMSPYTPRRTRAWRASSASPASPASPTSLASPLPMPVAPKKAQPFTTRVTRAAPVRPVNLLPYFENLKAAEVLTA